MKRWGVLTSSLIAVLMMEAHAATVGLDFHASQAPQAPEIEGNWIRPSESVPAEPIWGHAEGLRIGLWPLTGPRGLLRVYAPYLGHRDDRMINYIAVEPGFARRS